MSQFVSITFANEDLSEVSAAISTDGGPVLLVESTNSGESVALTPGGFASLLAAAELLGFGQGGK